MSTEVLAWVMVGYVAAMFGVSLWARSQIHNVEDFLVAGRRLPLWLAWSSLFATWFGAGTLLTVTDEVRKVGAHKAALDPIGAGVCLILAGLFFAARLWRLKLLTLGDFYRQRFGPRVELVASVFMVPGYCGWIAAQFTALAAILSLFFGISPLTGMLVVCVVGTGYTLLGGMWSVTLTDAVQTVLLLIGLVALAWSTFASLGDGSPTTGWQEFLANTPDADLSLLGTEPHAITVWLGLFLAGALGNLPAQDLMQRVFAAKSAVVARRACLIAGVAYLTFGAIPVVVGLASRLLFPDTEGAILAHMTQQLLSPWIGLIFILALLSAVMSTIDSAILAPASVLAQNILPRVFGEDMSRITLSHGAVIGVAGASLIFALLGESAFSLLETAYEIGLVSLLVPLVFGLYTRIGGPVAAMTAIGVGTSLWVIHLIFKWGHFLEPWLVPAGIPVPAAPFCAIIAVAGYLIGSRFDSAGTVVLPAVDGAQP